MEILRGGNESIIEAFPYFYGAKVAMTPELVPTAGGKFGNQAVNSIENTRTAYIFSSGAHVSPLKQGFKQGNYKQTVSDITNPNIMQEALWNDSTYNEGNIIAGSGLHAEALDYENFYNNNIKNGYKVKLDSSSVQVVVNEKNGTYVLGPYVATYPDDSRFSYVEDITITTDTGYTGKPSKVIFGSYSENKPYPSSGEAFFIEFSGKSSNYPTKVGVNMSFAYIEYSKAKYERLAGTGDIYQITGQYSKSFHHHDTDWRTDKNGNQVDVGDDYYTVKGKVYLRKVGIYDAQTGAHLLENERKWTRKQIGVETEVEKTEYVDLTIELGGTVWADEDGGKESVSNGIKDNTEKVVPNVIVNLYRDDGAHVGSTKTDANGEYKFTKLNAMYKYFVKFTYNGQYYQPTTYTAGNDSANGWGKGNWEYNSNAKDKREERLSFNVKFEKIGSADENYVGSAGANKTYTKQELLDAKIIDEFGNLIGNSNASMVQYVKDCMMDAYTFELYPIPDLFVIDTDPVGREYKRLINNNPEILYPAAYHINLGINPREESDLAIKKDVDHVTLEINGQTHTYTYDTLENKENAENTWDINVRLSDAYYDASYSRELYKSDYIYKTSMYGDETKLQELGKSKADELEVYITYKIMVRNQSMSIRCKVDEIVDYYDEDLEYVDNRSYIQIKRGENEGIYNVKASNNSRYSANTQTTIDGYDNLYVTGLDDKYLTAGQTAYVYLTFKVKKDTMNNEDWVRLDEEIESGNAIGVGKENIVEVNGYSTMYATGTKVPNVGDVGGLPAGIVDRDSNSGNLNAQDVPKDGTIKYENFEDDTDKAPNIRIILYRNDDATRVISGSVWEDIRTNQIEAATIGNGLKDDKEGTLINGVTVQLVELMDNGTEYVWREFGDNSAKQGELGGVNTISKGTGSGTVSSETPIINAFNLVSNYEFEEKHDGAYAFKSFMPGKYVVRFIYGDTVRTVLPQSLGGLNNKSYNGQDYKSTTYQEAIEQNKTYTWREDSSWNLGQETLGNVIREISAYNKETCNQNETFTYLYDITASSAKENVSDAKDIASRRNEVNDYSDNDVTNYIAEVLASHKQDYYKQELIEELISKTKMKAETGVMVIELECDKIQTTDQIVNNTSSYKITNVNFGLEERPKAGLTLDKKVTNVKLKLEDNSILFDAKQTATNVLWRDHKSYEISYKNNMMDEIRNNNKNKLGLVQLSMDEELMHGATIEITYQITVSNVGEVDYKENSFYYTGKVKDKNTVVKTRANQVIDYVANNLQFNVNDNKDWKVIEKSELIKDDSKMSLVNNSLAEQVEKYNTIIATENLNKELLPSLINKGESSASVPLVLTQLITSENDTDDLTYKNIVEIVKTSNDVGRRMEYSVVGNQDPSKNPGEIDSDASEVVRILPPFGNAGLYIIITLVALAAIGIVIVGTLFIKK